MSNKLKLFLQPFGINPQKIIQTFFRYPSFYLDFYKFKKKSNGQFTVFPISTLFPCIHDKYDESGQAKGHYFHQDLLVANWVFKNNPLQHYDVGSRIDGFVSHVASYRKIIVIDIRALKSTSDNIEYMQADLMSELPISLIESTESLSCLHTIEHFGLGRYGDPINFDGHILGFNNLLMMLRPNGKLYFSTPIGSQRIEFNAHRIFSLDYLINTLFNHKVEIIKFCYVDDNGDLHTNVELNSDNVSSNLNCKYGCGIFELKKL